MKKFLTMGAVLLVAMSALGIEWTPLGNEEATRWGATHRVIIRESDLTDTNLGTLSSQVLTGALVRANTAIEPVALVLADAFNINGATTNAYNSMTCSVGDTNSATQFMSAVQLNENGTEVYFTWATPAALTPTTTTLVYLGATNDVLTNVVMTAAAQPATQLGRKYYVSPDKIRFTFTAMTNQTLAALDRGEVWFFYKELRVGK